MNIPGDNLFDIATTIINTTPIRYFAVASTATNEIGLDVTSYAPAQVIDASVQAVPRSTYNSMGLDFNKRYISIWASEDFSTLLRDRPGDQVEWNGNRYEVMKESDWNPIDGWDAIICVSVPPP